MPPVYAPDPFSLGPRLGLALVVAGRPQDGMLLVGDPHADTTSTDRQLPSITEVGIRPPRPTSSRAAQLRAGDEPWPAAPGRGAGLPAVDPENPCGVAFGGPRLGTDAGRVPPESELDLPDGRVGGQGREINAVTV